MANWKKVIVSGSIAELAQVTASVGVNIPTASLQFGTNDDFVLTVGSQGSIEKRDPKTIGAAFQSMSVAGPEDDSTYGTDTFIAASGLNELVFVSGSNVTIETSHSITNTPSETVGHIKITALTSSISATENQTTVSSDGSVYTIGTVQDIATDSNVQFANINATGDVSASNIFLAGEIIHQGDLDTKIVFNNDEIKLNTNNGTDLTVKSGKIGIGNTTPPEKLTVQGNISASGHITASGDLHVDGDASIDGDLGIGGNIFSLTGFGVTIDDVAITSGSVNFGSGSIPSERLHKFTGSISITGSGITLTDGVFTGNGSGLTNLDADQLVNTHNLTWNTSLTQSIGEGSAYSITSSIRLGVHLSGSAITSSVDGLYIPGRSIRLDQITSSKNEGDILTWSGSNKVPSVIPIGPTGFVLTSNGANSTASFQSLPASTALGIETGSVNNDLGNGVSLIITSSDATINVIPLSGSDNQISVSGSLSDDTIHFRLADNISGISTVTASVGIKTGFIQATSITASGNLTVGGDLTVKGDTTLLHTSNVLVEDAFITLASGSTQTDGGIIVQTGPTTGKGLGWDNTIGRWGLQNNLTFNTTDLTPIEWLVSAKVTGSNPLINTTPTYGQNGDKVSSGQLWINTGSGDIWIYVD